MKIAKGIVTASFLISTLFLSACAPDQLQQKQPTSVIELNFTPSLTAASADISESSLSYSSPISSSTSIPSITGMSWDDSKKIINIGINPWPKLWSAWKMYIDGVEVPMEGGTGKVNVRPNAPLDQPPDGLLAGTLPWVTGLKAVDFPCCGSLQFSLPEAGLTNTYKFNLRDEGCATASKKECPAEWSVHEGDWVIRGMESKVIENTKLIQKGNIYIRDSATLTIKNSELTMERGGTPTIHMYIFVDPKATLIIDNSRIYPRGDGLACVMNRGETKMIDSPTSIHYFDMSENARLTMENSKLVYDIGGLLQVTGGSTKVTDSTIGALGLSVPAGRHLNAAGLRSGVHFDHWDVHNLIPDADYTLTLDNVNVLKDDFTGNLKHGPYERGWIFFLDPDAHVRLSDSELRKVFIELRNDAAKFENLKIGEPSSLNYRDIILKNVVLEGEWPFTVTDSELTLTDSNYLFLQPSGSSTIKLINSHMVEFIPREFNGTMIFENGLWTNAGEILGNVAYHSKSNNFTIKGSLKISDDLRTNLQWKDAQVAREFELILTDSAGMPLNGAVIKVNGREYVTDAGGGTKFVLDFNETNYSQPTALEAWLSGKLIAHQEIDFFTETPIRLKP